MIPYTTPLFQIHIEGDGSNKLADCDHIWANFRQGDLLLQKKEGVTFNADTGYDRHGSAANVAVTGNIYCVVAN